MMFLRYFHQNPRLRGLTEGGFDEGSLQRENGAR